MELPCFCSGENVPCVCYCHGRRRKPAAVEQLPVLERGSIALRACIAGLHALVDAKRRKLEDDQIEVEDDSFKKRLCGCARLKIRSSSSLRNIQRERARYWAVHFCIADVTKELLSLTSLH